MFTRPSLLLTAIVLLTRPAVAAPAASDLPARAAGTFVQRKTLADVEVTLVSTGTFRFVRDRFFEWKTLKPVPSVFYATPTNYALTVNGRTTTRALRSDISEIAQIFTIKEVRDFVAGVDAEPPQGFPRRVTVRFKNGDRLAIELTRQPQDEAAP